MIAELIKAGYFRETTLNGVKTLVLQHPVQVVIRASVLAQLKAAYPLHEETGGILFATPNGSGGLVVNRWVQLPNTLTGDARKTAYRPANSVAIIAQCVASGALPIRFHSHPLAISERPYDRQPLLFFQKTSVADRHNSYLPIAIDGRTLVLPDGLLSPNDRAGNDVRFYLYGGAVAPNSIGALMTNETVYVYFAIALVFVAYVMGGFRRAGLVLLVAGLASIVVFVAEKRPTGVKNSDGDLVISIP